MSTKKLSLKFIEDKKHELNFNIDKLISNFEKQTNVNVLMFQENKKPFKAVIIIDLNCVKL